MPMKASSLIQALVCPRTKRRARLDPKTLEDLMRIRYVSAPTITVHILQLQWLLFCFSLSHIMHCFTFRINGNEDINRFAAFKFAELWLTGESSSYTCIFLLPSFHDPVGGKAIATSIIHPLSFQKEDNVQTPPTEVPKFRERAWMQRLRTGKLTTRDTLSEL